MGDLQSSREVLYRVLRHVRMDPDGSGGQHQQLPMTVEATLGSCFLILAAPYFFFQTRSRYCISR